MAFDFFNEGIKKEAAIEFSKEENMFLESKLPFLDPKKTEQISIGSALEFLKFSGIRSEGIQKILKNCKIQMGKKTISYNQMKKLFRGVALHQSDIEPSTINIEANIKTKAPIFYDDESDEQGPPSRPPVISQPPKVQEEKPIAQTKPVESIQQKPVQDNPQHRQKPVQDKQNVFSFEAPSKPPSQYPPQPIQTPTFPQNTIEKESGLSIKIREFEARWVKLKTEGNKISGGEVKTLCKNFGQRSNLSKAWKVCCHTHSGALTKGEFFIFLQIVTSPNIPEALTQEMKQSIALLDQETSKKELKPQNPTQQPPIQKLASSMIFENFGKADSSVDVRGRMKTEEKIDLSLMKDNSRTLSQLQQVSKVAENHTEEITTIRRGQQTMNNILGQVQQFLTNVKNRNNETRGQVNELKTNQQLLNDRLNKVCVALNGIIVSQNSLIEELANDYANQNNLNFQRVSFLQNHVAQLTEQLQQKEQTIRRMLSQQQSHPQPPYQSKGHLKEPEPAESEVSPQLHPHPQKSQQSNHDEIPQEPQVQKVPHSRQESPNVPAHQGSPQVQGQKSEENEYQQRMRMKRAQVIQLIMHLTPLTPEEEPALIQRISEYSEEELNTVYYNCYQKLKARQVAQQQAAERAAHQVRESLPPDDEFKSSNFHGQPTSPQNNMFDD